MTPVRIENRTPHPVTLMWRGPEAEMRRYTIPPTLPTPRVAEARTPAGALTIETDRFPVTIPVSSMVAAGAPVSDLPDPRAGIVLVVSRMVCEARPDRTDLVFPDEMVRSQDGTILGCLAFGRPGRAPTPSATRVTELRRCANESCNAILPPDHTAIYCTNACAADDA